MKALKYIIQIPRYSLAGLLFYTATKKFVNYDAHLAHIRDVGFVPSRMADATAMASILVEAGVATLLLLNYKRMQVWGWRTLTALMLVYSYYVYFILHIATFVPCSCQGISESLSWPDHYWVNGAIAGIALGMLYYHHRMGKQKRDEALGIGSISTVQTI